MIATGGKPITGASVGILMLDAQFPRIPGDMGNAQTWPFPVLYRIVRGASPDLVVRQDARGLLEAFIEAARDLVRDGADGITTNCGFLSLYQSALQETVPVPVATSSLMQVPLVNATLPPGRKAGILTISPATLSPRHLAAASVPDGTPVGGTPPEAEFSDVILNDKLTLDVDAARRDNVEAALALRDAHSDLGAIVLECTNMIPYAADIRHATGLPVYSMYSFITWFQCSLVPRRFPAG